jgi:dTDP-4-amino-4,6-dideoxygalactose transaminase
LDEIERISKEMVSLPLNTEISNEQVEYVIECVRKFYKRSGDGEEINRAN